MCAHPALVPCSYADDIDDRDVDEYFDNVCADTDDNDSFSEFS